jgi:L-glyceraldehyde 3-phosphate reductase
LVRAASVICSARCSIGSAWPACPRSLYVAAISWVLRDPRVTSALVGASSVAQLEENLAAAGKAQFSVEEVAAIDKDAVEAGINIWAASSSR